MTQERPDAYMPGSADQSPQTTDQSPQTTEQTSQTTDQTSAIYSGAEYSQATADPSQQNPYQPSQNPLLPPPKNPPTPEYPYPQQGNPYQAQPPAYPSMPYPEQPTNPMGQPNPIAQTNQMEQAYQQYPGQYQSGYAGQPYQPSYPEQPHQPGYPQAAWSDPSATGNVKTKKSPIFGTISFAIVLFAAIVGVFLCFSFSDGCIFYTQELIDGMLQSGRYLSQSEVQHMLQEIMTRDIEAGVGPLIGPMIGGFGISIAGFVGFVLSIVAIAINRGRGWGIAGTILGVLAPILLVFLFSAVYAYALATI